MADIFYPTTENNFDLLTTIIYDGISRRSSDIHFQIERNQFLIRFRIDGQLYEYKNFPEEAAEEIVSRMKVLGGMDIAKHHVPQDGHFEFSYNGNTFNIRVSSIPTIYGESVVLRLHTRPETLLPLDKIGFEQDQLRLLKNMITSSSGIILVTGPTSSGKTTLLYSILNFLNNPTRSILTIEDPIELQINNIRQTQINEDMGLTFPKILRSVLRQDPNIIMLGEIRDDESALISIQAALSGILILSTFHTFDVPALVSRFMEMKIPPSVVAQAVKGVISVRLIRTICKYCKSEYTLSEFEQRIYDHYRQIIPQLANVKFQKGKGCSNCQGTGYLGRSPIFEIVYFDELIRSGIIERKPISFIYDLLKQKKIKSLQEMALAKVLTGETTFEEIARVTDFAHLM